MREKSGPVSECHPRVYIDLKGVYITGRNCSKSVLKVSCAIRVMAAVVHRRYSCAVGTNLRFSLPSGMTSIKGARADAGGETWLGAQSVAVSAFVASFQVL